MICFDIISLFPNFFESPLRESILAKAQEKGFIRVRVHDLRTFTEDKHHVTDDTPYGGGVGMVLKPEPAVAALEHARTQGCGSLAVLLTPQGERFTQTVAEQLCCQEQIILVCGRYEGVDERIREFVDKELSIGDYILNGGEAAALVILEAVSRLIPGVLGKLESTEGESFSTGLLEFPHYTRPRSFRGREVPEVLVSGHHREIERWRLRESLKRTLLRRPDLLEHKPLTPEEQDLLEDLKQEQRKKKETYQ
jgi:tRNA (guanine37-N1)-methyltransferase